MGWMGWSWDRRCSQAEQVSISYEAEQFQDHSGSLDMESKCLEDNRVHCCISTWIHWMAIHGHLIQEDWTVGPSPWNRCVLWEWVFGVFSKSFSGRGVAFCYCFCICFCFCAFAFTFASAFAFEPLLFATAFASAVAFARLLLHLLLSLCFCICSCFFF